MKSTLRYCTLAIFSGLALTIAAESQPTPDANAPIQIDKLVRIVGGRKVSYPYEGLPAQSLAAAITKVGKLIGEKERIIHVLSHGGDFLEVTTGTIRGPVSGSSWNYAFEKKGDKWVDCKATCPVQGLPPETLASAIIEIGKLIGENERIVDVRSYGVDLLSVSTGEIRGPLSADGWNFVFEKKGDKWVEVQRCRGVS